MFGLFDTPSQKIAKHVPAQIRPEVEAHERLLKPFAINFGFQGKDLELAIGFALAAWLLEEHRQDRISLSNFQGHYISNMGINCSKMLGDKADLAVEMANFLMGKEE